MLGVGSIALTAAAAQPLDPGARTLPTDVFAAGEGGFGSIGSLSLAEEPDEAAADGSGRGRDRSSPAVTAAGTAPTRPWRSPSSARSRWARSSPAA
jgi:hypothetical protein